MKIIPIRNGNYRISRNLKEYDIWLEKKKNRGDTDNGSGCNYSS